VAQLEIPVDTALYALTSARRAGVLSILNPAPARPLDLSQLADIDVITPNETELRVLCGRAVGADSDPLDDCRNLLQAGVRAVVLTRGARGALIVRPDGHQAIAAPTVEVVDTTGAGDAFTGTLATALAAGQDLERAVQRAVCAGALACTRMGVVPSLPDAAALDATLAAR
jgi:ribokinase